VSGPFLLPGPVAEVPRRMASGSRWSTCRFEAEGFASHFTGSSPPDWLTECTLLATEPSQGEPLWFHMLGAITATSAARPQNYEPFLE